MVRVKTTITVATLAMAVSLYANDGRIPLRADHSPADAFVPTWKGDPGFQDATVDGGVLSTDRFGYDGTVTRYDTLADAQAGTNPIETTTISDRDLSVYVVKGYGNDTNIIMGSWWYTEDEGCDTDKGRAGYGNVNGNTGVGFIQLYDADGSTDGSLSMEFQNYDGTYWTDFVLALSGTNADYPNDYARFWVEYQGAGADKVIYHTYELTLTAGGLEGVEVAPSVIEATNHPTSVTGTYSGIFENVSTTYPQNNGFYVFNLTLSTDCWAFTADLTPEISYDGCGTFSDGTFDASYFLAASTTALDAEPYPFDESAPRVVQGDAPAGWGASCWQGPATGKSNYHVWFEDVANGYAVTLEDLFGAGHGLKVSDIESISFFTKKGAAVPANRDWWITIYTQFENDGDDSGSWYDSRLHAIPDVGPGYTQSFVYDEWNLWTTGDGGTATNQLVFYDNPRGFGGYYATLADLGAGPVDWDGDNSVDHDYSEELLLSVTLQTDSGWNGFDGYIDGLVVTLTDGRIGAVNMVAGPTDAYVDDDYAGLASGTVVDWPYNSGNGAYVIGYNAFATIQEGIDAVSGSTVNVAAGTYVEQVHITTDNLNLIGAGVGQTILQSPEELLLSFSTGSNDNYPVLFVDGCTGANITGFTIDGANQGDTNYRFIGVGFWNAGGSLVNAEVLNVMNSTFSGAQHGVAIYAYNNTAGPYDIVLDSIVIDEFQKNAVALMGEGLTVDVDDLTITGAGVTDVTAQNGIQIGYGAGGTVDDCSISGIYWDGDTWTASGMLLYDATAVDMTNVTLDACQTAIYNLDTSGSFVEGAITNGGNFYGILAYSTGALAANPVVVGCQPLVEDYAGERDARAPVVFAVENSIITGTDVADTVGVYGYAAGPVELTVTNCQIGNWDYGVVLREDDSTIVSTVYGNDLAGNTYAIATDVAATQDASGNWYGVAMPMDVDALIDGDIDYSPWLASGTDTSGDPGFQGDFSELWVDDDSGQVGSDGYITEALGLVNGSTIYIAPGTYPDNLLIDQHVNIIGSGSGDNPLVDSIIENDANATVIRIAASGNSAGDPLLFQDFRVVADGIYGLEVHNGQDVQYLRWDNVQVVGPETQTIENEIGFKVATDASVSDLEVVSCAFDGCDYGWYFAKHGDWGPGGSNVVGVYVTDTTFSNNSFKGLYLEKLSEATFEDCVFANNGSDPFWNDTWNGGVDINLKGEEVYQDLAFICCDVTGNGLGYKEGAGYMIKARDDGGTYGAHPAALDGVLIDGGTVSGNERGIRFGEPAQGNAGPTSIVINSVNVYGNVPAYGGSDGSAYGDLIDWRAGTADAIDATNNYWGQTGGPVAGQVYSDVEPDPVTSPYSDILLGCGGTLSLVIDDSTCYTVENDTLVVEVVAEDFEDTILGGQFNFSWDDSVLSFLDAVVGDAPFTRPVVALDPTPGGPDNDWFYAVGIPNGDPGYSSTAPVVMARLQFEIIDEACDVAALVTLNGGAIPFQTRLTQPDPNGGGMPLYAGLLTDANAITIDWTAPVLTCPDDVELNNDPGVCEATLAYIETFDDPVCTSDNQSADCWYVDRYAPAAFEMYDFNGENVLKHSISSADSYGNRPSGYQSTSYNYQGRKYDVDIAAGFEVSVDLYIPASWNGDARHASLWATTYDAQGNLSGYPIMGFTSSDPNDPLNPNPNPANVVAQFRAWRDENPGSGWEDLGLPTGFAYDEWYTLTFKADVDQYTYTIDGPGGSLTYTYAKAGEVARIANVMLQAYNFSDATYPVGDDYDVYWDNMTLGPRGPLVEEACCLQLIEYVRGDDPGLTLEDPFPVGTTTITWMAEDCCGNLGSCEQLVTVYDVEPPVVTCPSDIEVNADAGLCTAEVTWPAATADDNCDGNVSASVVYDIDLDNDGSVDVTDQAATVYTFGVGTHRVIAKAYDTAVPPNEGTCEFLVTVLPFNDFVVDLELQGAIVTDLTRCVTFTFYEDCSNGGTVTLQKDVTFIRDASSPHHGFAMAVFTDLPCSEFGYTCVTAQDDLHTLVRQVGLAVSGTQYVADFTGANLLVQGDYYDDVDDFGVDFIDIVDFGVFVAEFGANYDSNGDTIVDGDTPCGVFSVHADANGDGAVDASDYGFITSQFGLLGDYGCCTTVTAPMPRRSITVAQLYDMGLDAVAESADINGDGMVNLTDVELFFEGPQQDPTGLPADSDQGFDLPGAPGLRTLDR